MKKSVMAIGILASAWLLNNAVFAQRMMGFSNPADDADDGRVVVSRWF